MSDVATLIIEQGKRFLEGENGVRYELPFDSADLYQRCDYFSALWGDDFFFVTGRAQITDGGKDQDFFFTESCDFILSDMIAYNPGCKKGNDRQEQARTIFRDYRQHDNSKFPTMAEVRKQANTEAGLHLLSGGGFIFVADKGEVSLSLLKRTRDPKVWSDFNGLVAEPNTAAKEIFEEMSIVEITPDNRAIVHMASFNNESLTKEFPEGIKRSQADVLRRNLELQGIPITDFSWQRATIKEIIPPDQHVITLKTDKGAIVGKLRGLTGFEKDQNTLVYRLVGMMTVEAKGSRFLLVDGEFERVGRLFSEADLGASITADNKESGTKQFLSSTRHIIDRYILALWPRTTQSMDAKPTFPSADL